MLAGFPMYDWPEVRDAADAFWSTLQHSLRTRGFDASDCLWREDDLASFWRSPDLLIGQTCGLPFATDLASAVRLIGTPAYDIGCWPGFYYSVLIAPRGRSHSGLERFTGRVAVNDLKSQSGYATLMTSLMAAGADAAAIRIEMTGSHRASVEAVADGRVDLAAIDAVSFQLAKRHMAVASEVEIVGNTLPTLGLPLITALPEDARDALADAMEEAVDRLGPAARETLLLTGFVRTDASAYAPLAENWALVQAWLGLQAAASVIPARISA
ncbi:PhnD/SsuA/transferrin family substrate-binding protein [Aliirhizobium terrae]|uniref:phosphate/phosphite/phosphonate ABC transporter substrate-binding protein n=1 Tax=Terrirhizobium terrae TaxID=2926709 RepID=UPI002576C874|nr:PhnD/SsuA/transferrin family substrate-binding protein [Rhizobium sp. CC-CFT758]WJH41309.1 PhnD/SsuA/transferrin family substrate-binding protein [Rhizobium sp. CC-CFT758]